MVASSAAAVGQGLHSWELNLGSINPDTPPLGPIRIPPLLDYSGHQGHSPSLPPLPRTVGDTTTVRNHFSSGSCPSHSLTPPITTPATFSCRRRYCNCGKVLPIRFAPPMDPLSDWDPSTHSLPPSSAIQGRLSHSCRFLGLSGDAATVGNYFLFGSHPSIPPTF